MESKQRFERHVERTDMCWWWTGATDAKGYGLFMVGSRTDQSRRCVRAHRYAYALYVAPVPQGLSVLHRCDQPSCVRPDHLFLGTHVENNADRHAKGRTAKGLASGRAKHPIAYVARRPRGDTHGRHRVTAAQVAEIRLRAAAGEPTKVLAAEFGLSVSGIKKIVYRHTWKGSDVGAVVDKLYKIGAE